MNDRTLRVYQGKVSNDNLKLQPGELICKDKKIMVGTGDATYELLVLQLEGKKKMTSKEFINGLNANKSIFLK